MKIKLQVSQDERQMLAEKLEKAGFEVTDGDDADYILHERNIFISHLPVRNGKGEKVHLPVTDIITIESFGHNIDVITQKDTYQSSDSLKAIAELLDSKQFLRISNSVIVNRRMVREIIPSFSMKFRLRLLDGRMVEVTRSYYHAFREFFNL